MGKNCGNISSSTEVGQLQKLWTSRNKYLYCPLPDVPRKKDAKKEKAKRTSSINTSYSSSACELCGKTFSSKHARDEHLKVHTGERPFPCDLCEKRFITKFALERHAFTHNPSLGKSVCKYCDKRFGTKEGLIVHIRTHSGEAPFPCDACDKKFTSRNSLNRHSLSHKNEKSYLCSECGKQFQSSQAIRLHLQSHRLERDYSCDSCRLRFKRALDLKRHQLTHREVRVIRCPLPKCKHHFRRKDNLLRHLRLTHNQGRDEVHETYNRFYGKGTTDTATATSPASSGSADSALPDIVSETSSTTPPPPPKNKKSKGRSKKATASASTLQTKKPRASKKKKVLSKDPPSILVLSPSSAIPPPATTPTALEGVLLAQAPQTSVTTSVIRMVKSCSPKKKCGAPTDPQPHSHTPYRRNPSPGHEYINYLNSFNHSVPCRSRVREPVAVAPLQQTTDLFRNVAPEFPHFVNVNVPQENDGEKEMMEVGVGEEHPDAETGDPDYWAPLNDTYQNAGAMIYHNLKGPKVPIAQYAQEEGGHEYPHNVTPTTNPNLFHVLPDIPSHAMDDYYESSQLQSFLNGTEGVGTGEPEFGLLVGQQQEQQQMFGRAAAVTVIKRAYHQSDQNGDELFSQTTHQEEPMGYNGREENEVGTTPLCLQVNEGVRGGGAEKIVNRDPRKNFLWENFSKNRASNPNGLP